jgi:CspA family cold shock protein
MEKDMANESDTPVLIEVTEATFGQKVGMCKWFNNVHGYGFLTIIDGDDKGVDVFVHHSGIVPANSLFKSLRKGEYVSFDVVDGAQGSQATNVRGIGGGPLLCDHIPVRKVAGTSQAGRGNGPQGGGHHGAGWTTVGNNNNNNNNNVHGGNRVARKAAPSERVQSPLPRPEIDAEF